MKRICFVTDSIFTIGGVQRVLAVIAKELAKEYDVTILTFDKVDKKDTALYGLSDAIIHYQFITYPTISGVKRNICKLWSGIYLKFQLKSKWSSNLYARSSFPSELRKVLLSKLEQEEFDVIIGVHAPLAARLATLRDNLQKSALIGWLHNSYEALFGEDSHYYIGAKRRRHYIYQFRKLDDVVVLCQDDANHFNAYDAAFTPKVIYNPITLTPGQPSSGNSKRFLTIGRFTPMHKGIDILIEAFYLFSKKNKDWQLDVVGEGNEEQKYRSLITQYHLENRITIHPFTNEIQNYYSQAQIYVLSSRWEGMPLVLVEAMSHGLPVITSDLPVCKEILGDFSMYFKNGNIEGLAQRLEDATHIDWQQKSNVAIKISQQFDISHIIKQWKKLLEK